MRDSFFVPLQTRLAEPVDVATANREVRPWLDEVDTRRIHATLKERPIDRFLGERDALRPLPLPYGGHKTAERTATPSVPLPIESMQHPLSVYEAIAQEIAA